MQNLLKLLILVALSGNNNTISAQNKSFIYELKLKPAYQDQSTWTTKEQTTQKAHVDYLDSLYKQGIIILGGIQNHKNPNQVGLVFLNNVTKKQAILIMQNDPSIQQNMMGGRIVPFTVFFEAKTD